MTDRIESTKEFKERMRVKKSDKEFEEATMQLLKELPDDRPVKALSLKDVWDRQQKKIDVLEAENRTLKQFAREAMKVSEFYSENLPDSFLPTSVIEDFQCDDNGHPYLTGKRAREHRESEIFKKVKGIIDE